MDFTAAAVERRVAEFDARYGGMEKVLWCLRGEAVRSLSGPADRRPCGSS